jgi:hypothetical protein
MRFERAGKLLGGIEGAVDAAGGLEVGQAFFLPVHAALAIK